MGVDHAHTGGGFHGNGIVSNKPAVKLIGLKSIDINDFLKVRNFHATHSQVLFKVSFDELANFWG